MGNKLTTPLDGKTVTKVEIATDKMALRFTLSDGTTVRARCDADCCSQTWIEHIEMPTEASFTVTAVYNIPLNEHLDTDDETLRHYGMKIATDKGDLVIDYRNESNGYYGGSLSFDDEYFYGGVYEQNISSEIWTEVKED